MNPHRKTIEVSPSTKNSNPIIDLLTSTLQEFCLHNLTQKVFPNIFRRVFYSRNFEKNGVNFPLLQTKI